MEYLNYQHVWVQVHAHVQVSVEREGFHKLKNVGFDLNKLSWKFYK